MINSRNSRVKDAPSIWTSKIIHCKSSWTKIGCNWILKQKCSPFFKADGQLKQIIR